MKPNDCGCCDARPWAVALGRWCLGLVLFFFGVGKLPDIGGFAQGMAGQFAKTWLPGGLTVAYGYAIPFLEVILGALLVLGLWRNAVLFSTGLYMITLTFGMVLLKQPAVFNNFAYTLATAALLFLGEFDCLTLGGRKRVERGA
jgi:thiosulfate dehydrogenase (quinone) large subunit